MAYVYKVEFKGGPEAGYTAEWSAPPKPPPVVNWGGDVYKRVTNTRALVVYRFDASATKLAAPGLAGVTSAWSRFTRALAHDGPKDLSRIRSSTARIRRLTRNHH